MPLGSLLHDRFVSLLARGGDHLDWAAIGGLASLEAGEAPGGGSAVSTPFGH